MRGLSQSPLAPCLGLALLLVGCFGSGHIPKPPGGSVAVGGDYALEFLDRSQRFYHLLIQRRFNTLETFNDAGLRDHFRTPDAFFDYYADLAQGMYDAHFERSRPIDVEVEEFLFENRFRVRVQVRFVGRDRRALRPGRTALVRLDRWERIEGRWWIQPGKL